MNRKTRVFISYKTGTSTGLTFQANSIRQALQAENYEVWMDTEGLTAGRDWNTQIYNRIPESDIILLLLAKETAESNWVRREVDVAKGAKVTILPVLIRGDFDKQEALDRLDIPRLQFANLLTGSEAEIKKLIQAIETLKDETGEEQVNWLRLLREGETAKPFDPPDKSITMFKIGSREIHLAGGDFSAFKGVDVFVNSENDYLQMARVFESKTISSILRYRGSHMDEAQRLIEDTVQIELDHQVRELGPRPVGKNTVIVTTAGHPKGRLRSENGARYIFHTATTSVQGDGSQKYLEPIRSDSGMKFAVKSTLKKIIEVDSGKGVFAPIGSPLHGQQEQEKDRYKPIESIAIPAFGTGHGGRPLFEVVPLIIRGMKEFLLDQKDSKSLKLKRIHLCLYSTDDVEQAQSILAEELKGKSKTAD